MTINNYGNTSLTKWRHKQSILKGGFVQYSHKER